jgi:hypothetical protein
MGCSGRTGGTDILGMGEGGEGGQWGDNACWGTGTPPSTVTIRIQPEGSLRTLDRNRRDMERRGRTPYYADDQSVTIA